MVANGVWRSLVSAFDWGSKGRRFKSSHPDFVLILSNPKPMTLTKAFQFLLVAFTCIVPSALAAQERSSAAENADLLFAFKIEPLITSKCVACHGKNPDDIKGGLDLTSREATLRGGDSGSPAVSLTSTKGIADTSPIYLAASRNSDEWSPMPPKENDAISTDDLAHIANWISAGAPWPTGAQLAKLKKQANPWLSENQLQVATSGGLSDAWTNRTYKRSDLWSFQPLASPSIPSDAGRNANPIDAFINAAMPRGLRPAGEADRLTLLRRLSFDLLGLPPTQKQIEDFVVSNSPISYELLVNQLLASKHYGEQWGRHWLDVVRYADSAGFANDFERPNAWRYRDYVIRSFNDDKPYDQFIREQIAGDEIDPQNIDYRIATGFLRMGPFEQTGMAVAKVTRQQFLDDVTASVGQVFLGQPLQCARCHDHKFDPIPTRDYYSIQSVFATTQFADVNAPFQDHENLAGFDDDLTYLKKRHEAVKELQATINNPRKSPDDFGRERLTRKWQTIYNWAYDRTRPIAFSVQNGSTRYQRNLTSRIFPPKDAFAGGVIEKTAILTGGDVFAPSEPVSPGTLSATAITQEYPDSPEGRRTGFANWLVHPDNPLTARVMVNRIWHYHFGRGIATNPNNFGATGNKPTHPELLDWLAAEFMERGWSIKEMHRLILNSDAYKRSSTYPNTKTLSLDPDSNYYSVFQPRRLDAEEIRDAMLAITDELNRQLGGVPARPDMNLEAALQPRMIMGTFAPSYVPNAKPEQRNRRSVYAQKLRGHRDPFMTTFNQPSPDESCEQRDASNITPQVFTLFNGEESADRSLALADLIASQSHTHDDAVTLAFQLTFGRKPDKFELAASVAHLERAIAEQEGVIPEPRVYPTTIKREANEENTGQPFEFTERLFEYEDYIHDLQPHEVDATTRGLADLCLVLLNSNEFVYIY